MNHPSHRPSPGAFGPLGLPSRVALMGQGRSLDLRETRGYSRIDGDLVKR